MHNESTGKESGTNRQKPANDMRPVERRNASDRRRVDSQDVGKRYLIALIDPRPLMCAALPPVLQSGLTAQDRSIHYRVLAFSSSSGLRKESTCNHPDMIIISFGARCVSEDRIREDICQLQLGFPDASVVVLSDLHEPCHILEGIRRGASAYIPTTLSPAVVVQALRLVQAGGVFMPHDALLALGDRTEIGERATEARYLVTEGFTRRQRDVLRLLREGKSNKMIAYELDIQESTVKVYVQQVMKKLRARNRTHAAFLIAQAVGIDEENAGGSSPEQVETNRK